MSHESPDQIAEALFGQTRRAILALLFGRPDQDFFVREVARAVRTSPGAAQPELVRLSEAGLLVRTRRGKQVFYKANRACPVFDELRGLMEKTTGLAGVLRATIVLLGEGERLRLAFVFGSVAAGSHASESDVDLMIIGTVTMAEAVPALRAASDRLSREVNLTLYTVREVQERLKRRDHFLVRVLKGPKIFLTGTANELEELVRESLAG